MKMNYFKRNTIWFLFLAVFLGMSACKKHDTKPKDDTATAGDNDGDNNSIDPKDMTARDIDSLKFYIWYINISDSLNIPLYLWNDQVPGTFKWYNTLYNSKDAGTAGQNVMNAIASFSPMFQGYPEDRYSFIDMTGAVSDELQGGQMGDFGYMIGAAQDKNSNIHIIVEYTYEGSPARNAGIKRGDEVLAINGNTNMDLTSESNVDRINNDLFSEESVSLKLIRPDSTIYTADLQSTSYHINPVLFDSVYTVGTEKVGYFVYNTFVNVSASGNGATAKAEIDDAFSKFKTEGISDLIVDLRYNGGGSVATSAYLDNLISPASAAGKEMFHYEYNQPLTNYFSNSADPDVKANVEPLYFDTVPNTNNLNLSRVFFIVSGGTASASELTINNLKPYMDVYLVGKNTYGKPVGFFTVSIDYVTQNEGYKHVADMYAINFRSVNSTGETNYFGGMAPDADIDDYIDVPWGDTTDPRLRTIFYKIKNGSFLTEDEMKDHREMQNNARKSSGTLELPGIMRKIPSDKIKNPYQFNGMVDYRASKAFQDFLRK